MSCPLDPTQFVPYKVQAIHEVNYNTKTFRFALAEEKQALNLPVASCVMVAAPIGADGALVMRPYTPASPNTAEGYFDLIVKTYANGVMSRHIHSLQVGDSLLIKGPFKKWQVNDPALHRRRVGMVAGGTGITPMLQLLNELLTQPADVAPTSISLVFSNREERDILLRAELDALAAAHPDRLQVHYFLQHAPEGWTGRTGYLTADTARELLPPAADDSVVFVCGPPAFMAAISGDKNPDKSQGEITGLLKDLGFSSRNAYKM